MVVTPVSNLESTCTFFRGLDLSCNSVCSYSFSSLRHLDRLDFCSGNNKKFLNPARYVKAGLRRPGEVEEIPPGC